MGYESKLYFVKDYGFGSATSKFGINDSDTIATLDMSKMGKGYYQSVDKFLNLFDTETPFSLSVLDTNETGEYECMVDVIEDKYGTRLCYCKDKAKLLRAANKILKEIEPLGEKVYDRFYIMRDMIKAFVDKDDVYIVHYGY